MRYARLARALPRGAPATTAETRERLVNDQTPLSQHTQPWRDDGNEGQAHPRYVAGLCRFEDLLGHRGTCWDASSYEGPRSIPRMRRIARALDLTAH